MIEDAFRAALASYAPLVALVGNRIAQNAIPQGPVRVPLVVYTSSHELTLGLDNSVLADKCTLSTQCWAETSVQADQLADLVTQAIAASPAAAQAVVVTRASGFDEEIGKDGVLLDIEWWAD